MAIQINGKKVVHLGNMTIPIIKGDIGPEGKQGKQGIPGIDGKDGQTPLRGIDYWTTEDKNEIINEIDNKVQNDLQEYYKKTETYNKEEIDNKISTIPKFDIKVVESLPTSNISETTVYLVKSGEESNNLYTEYIYADGKWEKLGEQEGDLSNFYNKNEIDDKFTESNNKITNIENQIGDISSAIDIINGEVI